MQWARSSLILSVADNLIGLVVRKQDPIDFWDLLCKIYNEGNQQQILFFTNKLYGTCMKEGEDVSAYLMKTSNIRIHLIALEESILDKQLINIVLNGFLRFYEIIIQSISYMTNPTFEDVMDKILTEAQCMTV